MKTLETKSVVLLKPELHKFSAQVVRSGAIRLKSCEWIGGHRRGHDASTPIIQCDE